MNTDDLRREAAFYSVDTYVRSGMQLALGSDLTITHAIERLKQNLAKDLLRDIVVLATSSPIADIAMKNGIPLMPLEQATYLDLYLGGAEEINVSYDHIIGMNCSPFREKMAAATSRGIVIMAIDEAFVDHIGSRSRVPIEVLPFGWNTHKHWLINLGLDPKLRRKQDGTPFTTEDGNYIYDCSLSKERQQVLLEFERQLEKRTGIVASGFFRYGWEYETYRIVVATANNGVRDVYLQID